MKECAKYIALAFVGICLSGAIIISNRFEVVASNVVIPHYIVVDNITGKIYQNTAGSSLIYEVININPEKIETISKRANSRLSGIYKKADTLYKLIKAMDNAEFNDFKEQAHKDALKICPELYHLNKGDINAISEKIDWQESDKILDDIRSTAQ